MSTWHNSTCPHDCPSACALQVEKLADDRIGRVRGSPHNPYTDGVICAKVSKYAERTHHPDRLMRPMVRTSGKREEPRFAPIEWDEALDRVVDRFQAATAAHGAESVWPYYYGGTMGKVHQYGAIRFARAFGFSGMKRTFCVQIAYDGWRAGTGAMLGSDPRELADSELIILWGCNAAATQINVMHHVAKARRKGAKLVVVDPYETPTAKIADLHLAPRPGTDGAVACAVMHQLFASGTADRDYLESFTDDPDALESHLVTRDADWAETISGVPAGQIRKLADWYGATGRSFIRLGIGFSRQRNGAANVHAVSCLPAVSGAWKQRGGGALLSTGDNFHLDMTHFTGLDLPCDGVRMLDMSQIGPILCGDQQALQNGPPVSAMLIQSTNPALVAPDLARVREGLQRDDLFVCVHEQFMTETTAHADLILPATSFVEHEDLYSSYGQTFLQHARPVITPPGECRSNGDLLRDLAKRLGSNYPGFDLSSSELIRKSLTLSGYPEPESFEQSHFHDTAKPFEDQHFLNGFGWPDGRFRFAPNWEATGPAGESMPALPDHWAVNDETTDAHPLKLVAAPSRGYLNSSFNQSPSSIRREKKPWLKVHPETATRFGITAGKPVTVGNTRGAITATAQVMEAMQRDTVVIEGIWPASAFPEHIGVNVLISAEPAAPNGGAVFHDTAVWIKAAS